MSGPPPTAPRVTEFPRPMGVADAPRYAPEPTPERRLWCADRHLEQAINFIRVADALHDEHARQTVITEAMQQMSLAYRAIGNGKLSSFGASVYHEPEESSVPR